MGLIASAISVGRGGIGVALTKIALGGMLGMEISLDAIPGKTRRDDFKLFSESQGRILVTINPKNKNKFERIIKGNIFAKIGKVTFNNAILVYGENHRKIINLDLKTAVKAYKSTFKNY